MKTIRTEPSVLVGIREAVELNTSPEPAKGIQPLAVYPYRMVVVGENGGKDVRNSSRWVKRKPLPKIQGLAAPNTMAVSEATFGYPGYFECQNFRSPEPLRGVATS